MAAVESIYSSLILDTSQYEAALRKIVGLSNEAGKTFSDGFKVGKESVDKANKSMSTMASSLAQIAGAVGFGALAKSVLSTTAEFQKYNAILKIALGSQTAASAAMEQLTKFAAKTPFQLGELTEAYIKMVNRGIKPTMKEMNSIGDVASSQGKSFLDLSEAILGAATGETERLKAFGITAQISGEKIALSFKGQRIEANKSAESIKNAIVQYGLMEGVQGSMDAISQTLTGSWSNLGDAADALKVAIGDNLAGSAQSAIQALTGIITTVKEFSKTNPVLFATIVQVSTAIIGVTVIIPALISGYTMLSGYIVSTLVPSFTSLAVAVGISTGGLSILIGMLATAGAALVAYYNLKNQNQKDSGDSLSFASAAGKLAEVDAQLAAVKSTMESVDKSGANAGQTFLALDKNLRNLGVDTEYLFDRSTGYMTVNKETLSILQKQSAELQKQKNIKAPKEKAFGGEKIHGQSAGAKQNAADAGMFQPLVEAASRASKTIRAFFETNVGRGVAGALNATGQIADQWAKGLAAGADLAAAKFRNLQQKIGFLSAGLSAGIDAQKAQVESQYQSDLDALNAQHQAIQESERQHQIDLATMRAEFDESAKAENDRKFEEALAVLTADYEAKKVQNNKNAADDEQRIINDEQLMADFNDSKIKLRSDFDQKLLDTKNVNNANIDAQEKDRAEKAAAQEKAIDDQKAAKEKEKAEKEKALDKQKADDQRKAKLFEWSMGRASFDLQKQATAAQIQLGIAQGIMGAISSTITIPFPGNLIAAGIVSAMVIRTGMMSLQANGLSQYPPPPVFADGGMATQPSIFGEAGAELAIPMSNPGKDFGALKEEVARNLTGGSGGMTNIYLGEIQIVNGLKMSADEIADYSAQKIRSEIYQAVSR